MGLANIRAWKTVCVSNGFRRKVKQICRCRRQNYIRNIIVGIDKTKLNIDMKASNTRNKSDCIRIEQSSDKQMKFGILPIELITTILIDISEYVSNFFNSVCVGSMSVPSLLFVRAKVVSSTTPTNRFIFNCIQLGDNRNFNVSKAKYLTFILFRLQCNSFRIDL